MNNCGLNRGRFAQRIESLSDTKKQLLARCLEDHDLDASWLFAELPVPPRNPTEMMLVEIWEQVLRVEDIGVEDNFFDLGGDSILSLRIVTKARQQGLLLSSRQLFENPTIARLAAVSPSQAPARSAPQEPSSGRRSVTLDELKPELFPEAELSPEETAQIRRLLKSRSADAERRDLEAASTLGASAEQRLVMPRRSARF